LLRKRKEKKTKAVIEGKIKQWTLEGWFCCWSSHTPDQNMANKLLPYNQLPQSTTFLVFPLSKWKSLVRGRNRTVTFLCRFLLALYNII